jgi:hypothetical protein
VPVRRNAPTKRINVMMDLKLLRIVDAHRLTNRSRTIEQALVKWLNLQGVRV